jgi:hypothetical protein
MRMRAGNQRAFIVEPSHQILGLTNKTNDILLNGSCPVGRFRRLPEPFKAQTENLVHH